MTLTDRLRRSAGRPQEGAATPRPQNPQADPQALGEAELAKWKALPPLEVPGYAQRDVQPRLTPTGRIVP